MPLPLAAAAAIAGIVSGVIAVGAIAYELGNSEADFETLRSNMNAAARSNPRVVKHNGIYYFYHSDDYDSARVTSAGVAGTLRGDGTRRRIVCFRPNDGWFSNSWTIWTYTWRSGQWVVKQYTATNQECAQMFREGYLQGGMAMQQPERQRLADGYA